MYYNGGGGSINGFSFQKNGIDATYTGGIHMIRNNYFYNCGINLAGGIPSYGTIMNNQIKNGTIYLSDIKGETVSGNTITNSVCGLYVIDTSDIPTVTKNTFKNNKYAVYFNLDHDPGRLTTFSGNTYSGNKYNIVWGSMLI
jgi:parallel beta-helix repeat protein